LGGANGQVIDEVQLSGYDIGDASLIQFFRITPHRNSMASKLANELMDAANDNGNAIQRRNYRMAEGK